ncbi:hypothetical protein MTO96_024550 [Rhipicephalus appendiculatus]
MGARLARQGQGAEASPEHLPLKKRKPRVSAELEAKARAGQLSPQEMYWDPRYKSYFYAGELTTTADAAARKESPTRAQHTATDVHASTTGLDNDGTMSSILVHSRGSRRRSRARRRRRISFSVDSVDTMDSRSIASDPSNTRVLRVCLAASAFAAFMLLWVLLVLWLSGYLDDYDGSLTEGDGAETAVRSTEKEDQTSADKEETEERDKKTTNKGKRLASDFATPKVFTPPRDRDSTSLASHVCLNTHRDDVLYNHEPADSSRSPSHHPRARHCDVLVRCCYVLENNMTLRPDIPQTDTAKPRQRNFTKRCGDDSRRPGTTLAAVLEQDSAFKKLLSPEGHRARSDFARNALRLARSEGYAGVRLWLSEAVASRAVEQSFVRKLRRVATALRKANCTLGFFLPYPAAHPSPKWYVAGLRVLADVLNSPLSILLYPTTSVLRKRSWWPSPAKMAIAVKTAETSPRRSVCYLLLSATAVSVIAAASCDVDKVQRVSVSRTFLSSSASYELCRSWNLSRKLSSHRYYSYSCGFGKEGIVFQTSQQSRRFCEKLLDLTQSSCFGFIDGERRFRSACVTESPA